MGLHASCSIPRAASPRDPRYSAHVTCASAAPLQFGTFRRHGTMAATALDSAIFGNLFGTEAMRQVFSDENRTRKYLDIEAALARVQARLGIIPEKAAAEIVRNCRVEKIDLAKLRQQ